MGSRDKNILIKILQEISLISEMTDGYNYIHFESSEKTKRAVCMTLINIGEMVKLLSAEIKQNNPSIPWRSISGLRDVTAHGYQTLRMEDIWETIATETPLLKKRIKEILSQGQI
ncbi:MAG: DUF86 domain-containing protein [Oscillospiraceae bacterium]|nr:DUF86 domain-containing protein [Oscillospiraceae bacterium]